jgi:stress-induced morphogen
MGVDAAELQSRLESTAALSPATVSVADISGGCGASFAVSVVSPAFEGVRALERHRMLHAALGDDLAAIHALKLTCRTPAQEEARLAKDASSGGAGGGGSAPAGV